MLKTIKPTKMRISRSLSNPLRTIGHIWPVFTVLYISLNISRSWLLFFKNNPIFDISGKFAIEWWYSFWFLVQNSLRKAPLKMTKISKKIRFFENLIVLKGLNGWKIGLRKGHGYSMRPKYIAELREIQNSRSFWFFDFVQYQIPATPSPDF